MINYELIKYSLIGVTTMVAICGAVVETRDQTTRKLNVWGYVTVLLLMIAFAGSVFTEWKDSTNTEVEKGRIEAELQTANDTVAKVDADLLSPKKAMSIFTPSLPSRRTAARGSM